MRFLCPVRVQIELRIPIYWAPWESHPSLRDTCLCLFCRDTAQCPLFFYYYVLNKNKGKLAMLKRYLPKYMSDAEMARHAKNADIRARSKKDVPVLLQELAEENNFFKLNSVISCLTSAKLWPAYRDAGVVSVLAKHVREREDHDSEQVRTIASAKIL